MIRRPFPKRTNFDTISPRELQKVEDEINTRPMKRLDYKTPAEVLASLGALTG
jgi:IS30 family transposase